jgi:phage terminase large subunit-like protein
VTITLAAPAQKARAPRAASIPDPFTLPHFRAWASDLILDTGESWHPEDFQEAFAEDLFSGIPECWLIVPEGNGKTTLMAGLALYHCEHREFASVPVAAASREQAEHIYRQAEGFVLRSERLYAPVHSAIQAAKGKRKTEVPRFMCLEGYRRINHHAGGRIQVFAADDRTGDGVIPTLGLLDELHRHRDLALYRTWAGKLTKRGGQIGAISTSGELGSDFEQTRQRIREETQDVVRKGSFVRAASPRLVLHEWALPDTADPEDIAAVKSTNPFSGITEAGLAEKFTSPTMTMHHWLRFVCNRPMQDQNSWLGENGPAIWDAAEQPYTLQPNVPTYVGIDIALKRDTSAVVIVQRRTDQVDDKPRYHAIAKIWVPTEDRPVDVTDVMKYLRDICGVYQVESIAFDPRFFDVPAKMLTDEGYPMAEVPQTPEHMSPAVGSLYEAILNEQITHEDDAAFTNHILNAVPRWNDRGFILSKSKSRGKIDAADALTLAYDQVLRHEGEEPSVYEDRGLVAI